MGTFFQMGGAGTAGNGIGAQHRLVVAGDIQLEAQKLTRLKRRQQLAVFGHQEEGGHGFAFLVLSIYN